MSSENCNNNSKQLPGSITKEQLEQVHQLMFGALADYSDPQWGTPLIELNGFTLDINTPPLMERTRKLKVDESDVFVTSFPRSGTTWMQHIVWLLVTQDFDPKEPIDLRYLELDYPPPYPSKPENFDKLLEKMQPPRFFKSHYAFDFLPRDVLSGKVIYMYRNPKDAMVSYFHLCRAVAFTCFSGTFEDFFNLFLEGRMWYGPWHKHVKSYYEAAKKNPSTILLMSYEELKRDRMTAIKKVANFIGKANLSEEVFQRIYDATSFEAMKENDKVNYSWLGPAGMWDATLPHFLRKGIVGDSKNYFTAEMETRLNDFMAKNMADVDLKFVDDHSKI